MLQYKLRRCTVDINKSVCNNYLEIANIDRRVWKKRMERKKGKKLPVQPTIVQQSPQAVFLENLNLIPQPSPPQGGGTKKNSWWSQPSRLEDLEQASSSSPPPPPLPQGGETVVQDSPPPPPPPPPSSNNNYNNNVYQSSWLEGSAGEQASSSGSTDQEYPLDLSMKKKLRSPPREYPPGLRQEIALAALKACNNRMLARHYSERLGCRINESTIRGIKKRYLNNLKKGKISPPPLSSNGCTETVSPPPPPPSPPPQSSATGFAEDLEQASSSTDQVTVDEMCDLLVSLRTRSPYSNRFNQSQRKELETMFLRFPYLNRALRGNIADKLQITEDQVSDWFCAKRKRVRAHPDFIPSPSLPLPPSAEDSSTVVQMDTSSDSDSESPAILTANRRYPPQQLTQDQVDCLTSFFFNQAYPNTLCRTELANKTGLRLSQVTDWFQNKRRLLDIKDSTFSIWANEERAKLEKKNPDLQDFVVNTILGRGWQSMTSEEKQAYSEKESTKELVRLQEEGCQQLFFVRTQLNVGQTKVLQSSYDRENYPDSITVEKLAKKIGEGPMRVRNWFKRRRAKERKTSLLCK